MATALTLDQRVVFVSLLSQASPMTIACETRHLLLLVALDRAGSLNTAARELHLSPSALSQQLRELEDRLGGPLFSRQWRRLVATAAGRRLTDTARALIGDLSRAEDEVRNLIRGAAGSLRVATSCHQSYAWLPGVLRAFAAQFPGVDVTVVADGVDAPCDALLARKLDVALVTADTPRPRGVTLKSLFQDELVLLVGSDHPAAKRSFIALRALRDEHLWSDPHALEPHTVLGRALAREGGILPKKLTPVPPASGVAVEMARENLGVALLPRWAAAPLTRTGELHALRLGRHGLAHEWLVATRSGESEPALDAFLDALSKNSPGSESPQRAERPRAAKRATTHPLGRREKPHWPRK
jgi:LysR family transcriptional regulator for metE and metH